MFDLEKAIADWQRQLAADGVKGADVLTELESHLRDDVEDQMRSGLSAQEAFEAAIGRIGPAGPLQTEFEKVGTKGARERTTKRSIFSLGYAANQSQGTICMNTPQMNSNFEPWWATYAKAAAFLVPAVSLWAFSVVFLFPKVQEICRDANLGRDSDSVHRVMGIMNLLKEHGTVISAAFILGLILLEWRSGKWPRYRRASVGVTVFLVNAVVLVLITTMFTFAMMGAPSLFRTK